MSKPNLKRRALFAPVLITAALAGAPAPAAAQAGGTLVPVAGIVSGSPESVSFSGQARVQSRLVPDPDFGRPSLLLTIDLSSVSGVGTSTKAVYSVATQELVQRRLAGTHVVTITFPFSKTSGATVVRSAVASFNLDFDVNTGAVTNASGNVATPNF
jgi:hypothetical protein